MISNSNINRTLDSWYNFKLKIIIEGIIVGIFAGFIVTFYRFLLEKAIDFSRYIYSLQLKNPWLIPIWIVILIIMAYVVGVIVKKEPMAGGSGIPQVEGVLLGKLHMDWIRVIAGKFIGGVISIGAGLSLGREGPSIQIGAAVGQGISIIFKRIKVEEKFLITAGASAGLSAAFSAPLAGVIFALEEVHKSFSPIIMTSTMAASITASIIAKYFFGMGPIFNFHNISPLPLNNYLYIVLLGIIVGILGVVFNKVLFKTQDIYAKQKWLSVQAKPIISFLAAGILGLLLPEVLGGGNDVVASLVNSSFSLKMLLLILIVKFIFTMVSYGSSAPGGIFLPLLVIGAVIGAVYGDILKNTFGFNQLYIDNLVILAMAGYFSAIVKSPITGSILITEMTGSFNHLLSVSVVSLTAYLVADIMNSKPIYEALLERMLKKENNKYEGEDNTKIILEIPVCLESKLVNKKIKEMKWPAKCLLVGIRRGEEEIIPKGDTIIYSGDYLIVLTNEGNASVVRQCLAEAAEKCIPFSK